MSSFADMAHAMETGDLGMPLIRAAVQRQITCAHTGNVLDVTTAVLLDVEDAAGNTIVMEVMDPAHWSTVADTLRALAADKGLTLNVYDGADYDWS